MKRTLRGSKQVSGENLTQAQQKDLEKLKTMAKQYEGKSDGEVLDDLKKVVSEGRRNGTLTDQKLHTLFQSVAPMLSGEQKNRLNELMRRLGG